MKDISKRDLRVFLGVWAGIFAVFFGFGIFRHDNLQIWALCGFGVSLVLMIVPRIITPLGLVFRLFGRDVLGLKLAFSHKDKSQSLFKIREIQPTSMKNQF